MSLLVLKPNVFAPEEVETIVASLEMIHETSLDFGALEIVEFHPKHTTGTSQQVHAGKGAGMTKAEAKKARDIEIATGTSGKLTKTGSPAMTDDQLDSLYPTRKLTGKTVNSNGTLSIEGLDSKGNLVKFSDEAEAKIQQKWDDLGPDKRAYVDNLVAAGKLAIGVDLKTGKITDFDTLKSGLENSKWYDTAGDDARRISEETGIDQDNVVAATTVLSSGRQWSGVANGNAETARRLADIAANPRDIEVSQAAIDLMAWKAEKATKGPGQIGLQVGSPPLKSPLKAGTKVNSNDLDSATLVELMYASNSVRGHSSFQSWADETTSKGKIGMKSSKTSIKIDPEYPLFTSKGTHQVKQAMGLMRGEVTAREAVGGPKFSSFYSNIRRPDVDYSVTNDVWQYRIQAGNLPLTSRVTASAQKRLDLGPTKTASIAELTLGKGSVNSAQGLLQTGAASKSDGLSSGDGMFRDSTGMMKTAISELSKQYPEQFGGMKGHEFQALVWVHFGGGQSSRKDQATTWDAGLAEMKEVGL